MDFVSNEEIVLAARKNLHQGAWDYLVGGSESETTMRRNRLAFDRWGFRPRILVDVSKIDTSTTFLGQQAAHPGDAGADRLAAGVHARGRRRRGQGGGRVRHHPRRQLGDGADAGGDRRGQPTAPKIFQLYVQRRRRLDRRTSWTASRQPATWRWRSRSTRRSTAAASAPCSPLGAADRRVAARPQLPLRADLGQARLHQRPGPAAAHGQGRRDGRGRRDLPSTTAST